VIGWSDATVITAIIVSFFAVLVLAVLARSLFTRDPPAARRFRVGVFVERDHEQDGGDG
jgi:hypothetical protein